MSTRDYAATAMYFARRAAATRRPGRRESLDAAAAIYQAKARAAGQPCDIEAKMMPVVSRRERLVKMSLAYCAEQAEAGDRTAHPPGQAF